MIPAAARRSRSLADLAELAFDNSFVRELPGDPVLTNVPRQVSNACYTRVDPTPVAAPRLLAWSDAMGELLGIAKPANPDVLAGNRVLPGMQPYAARYGGHQFGHWAGQLGDGRATGVGATRVYAALLTGRGTLVSTASPGSSLTNVFSNCNAMCGF